MNIKNITAIEGLLFLVGDDGIEIEQLLTVCSQSQQDLDVALSKLKAKFNDDDASALQLKRFGTQYKLTTKSIHKGFYEHFFSTIKVQQLSNAALEVLAIIAYNHPITRAAIEDIRGVNSDGVLRKLLMFDLVTEYGREQSPGNPVLFSITPYFLDYFGLHCIEELPKLKNASMLEISDDIDIFMTKYQEQKESEQLALHHD
ncbi:segregation and condensation protein B [Erysipelotrichaceae bacterium]|nr:segregation and condensation protein B [Erysipelotrichaceae bacterium]